MKQIGVTFNHSQVSAFIVELGSNDNPPRTIEPLTIKARKRTYEIEYVGDNVYKVSRK